MKDQRIYYWDNLKAILIFLVVLGHFLSPISGDSKYVQYLYFLIYLFHIPAFVLVSGYFAKSYVNKKESRGGKLIGYLILFYVYKILLWATKTIMAGEVAKFKPFQEEAAPWYMLSMFFWLIALPLFARIKPVVAIGISVAMALMVGFVSQIGEILCLSRTIVFLPFFLIGYYFKEEWIEKITAAKSKLVAVLILFGVCLLVMFNMDIMNQYGLTMFGSHSYSELKTTIQLAFLARGIWFLIALLIALAVMSLISKKKIFITYIGQRTLAVYILHRLIRQIFVALDLYRYFDISPMALLVGSVAISMLITWACSLKIFDQIFKFAFKVVPRKQIEKNKNV